MRKVTEDFIGTCQACFGEFKVNESSKLVVLHGYKRPGDGYTHGECAGTASAPFEYDTALTVQIIAIHRSRAAAAVERARKLTAGEITSLTRHWNDYDRQTFRSIPKSEVVTPGHKEWDRTLRIEIARAESDDRYHTRTGNYLQMKVDAWTPGKIIGIDLPATGRSRTLRKAYDPDEADAAEALAAERAKRAAKPGKLKVLFYQSEEPRNPAGYKGDDAAWRAWYDRRDAKQKVFLAACKTWAKANIVGKSLVRAVSDYDLPRAIRDNGSFDVIAVHLPWDYLNEVTHMFSSAEPFETDAKKRSFTVSGKPEPH